jgi:hypothetical protein
MLNSFFFKVVVVFYCWVLVIGACIYFIIFDPLRDLNVGRLIRLTINLKIHSFVFHNFSTFITLSIRYFMIKRAYFSWWPIICSHILYSINSTSLWNIDTCVTINVFRVFISRIIPALWSRNLKTIVDVKIAMKIVSFLPLNMQRLIVEEIIVHSWLWRHCIIEILIIINVNYTVLLTYLLLILFLW